MKNLKRLRIKHGKTQQEIADYLGMTRAAYTNIENGKRETDFTAMNMLASYFEVSIDYLFGKTDDPTPPNKKKPTPETVGPALTDVLKKCGYLQDGKSLTDEDADRLLKYIAAIYETDMKDRKAVD